MPISEQEYIEQHLTEEPPIPCDFKVGDKVTFTNDFGVEFPDREIIGFAKPDDPLFQYGNFIHLSKEAFWFPVRPTQLMIDGPKN